MPKEKYYLPSRKLVSQANASLVEPPRVQRSQFINSWNRITAFEAGYLVPFLVDEIMPGDHMRYNVSAMLRMATPLFPIFSTQRVDTHFFFTPSRLVWTNFVRMMGEQDSPGDSIAFTTPQIILNDTYVTVNSIFDHFGIPPTPGNIGVNALPFRMYNLIWNTWFRDQNLQNGLSIQTDNGPDLYSNYVIQPRGKMHDYFTSCLPAPQKGTAPTVPLGGEARIKGLGVNAAGQVVAGPISIHETGNVDTSYTNAIMSSVADQIYVNMLGAGGTSYPLVFADLSTATGVSINTLRQAWMVQTLLERDMRGGTRYIELVKSHFDVINPDFRLQRPEYIGGGSSTLNVTPIAQTVASDDSPLGALGAAATSAGHHTASYAATEHGFILGLISVRSELAYQEGLHRMFSRKTRYDYPWPELTHLGEQAVFRQELYMTGTTVNDESIFGYQERYQEFRQRYSEITGIMRSQFAGTLDAWHMAQFFDSTPPTLSADFIKDQPPMTRILAAGALAQYQHYLADILINRTAIRPLPTYGTPASIGRF